MSVKIATELADTNMIFLRERNNPIVPGQAVTLLGFQEIHNAKILNEKGEPFCMVLFAIKECCDECRQMRFHHKLSKAQFDGFFQKTKELSLIPHTPSIIMGSEDTPKTVTVNSVIDKMNQVLSAAGRREGYVADNCIALGRFCWKIRPYAVANVQKVTLSIEQTDFHPDSRTRIASITTPYDSGEMVAIEKVQTFLDYYNAIKRDLERIHALTQEVLTLYDKIEAAEVQQVG